MSIVLDDNLLYHIYSIVEEIPEGCVATYGQVARLIGKEKNSRLVGRALKMSFNYDDLPCHRVVNYKGRVTPGWIDQVNLLKHEGITFKDDLHVDIKKHKWNI